MHQHFAPGWTLGLAWGRGVGKSHFLRTLLYLFIAQHDGEKRPNGRTGVRCVLVLPTLKQATDLYAQDVINDLTGDGKWAWLGADINRSKWLITFPGGSSIQFLGAISAASKRGFRCDLVACDESDDIAIDFFDSVVGPWFTEPWSHGIKVVAGTPRRGRRGLLYQTYGRGSLGPDGKFRLVDDEGRPFEHYYGSHATGYDVAIERDPAGNTSAAYLDKQRAGMPVERFAREYLCDFDASEGLVYPGFLEGFHIRDADLRTVWREYIVGVDWGFTDAQVMLVIGIAGSGRDTTAHVLDEVYTHGLSDSQFGEYARKINTLYPGASFYADPSRPGSIDSFRREYGIKIVAGENAILDGIATVQDMLHVRHDDATDRDWAQLYVAPHCKHLIEEFSLYRHKRDRANSEVVLEGIADGNDHAMDSLRYGLHTHFGGKDRRMGSGYGHR